MSKMKISIRHLFVSIVIFVETAAANKILTNEIQRVLWGSEFPLWIETGLQPPFGSNYFGVSTAISKTNLIIGAPATCGYVAYRDTCSPTGSGNGTAYIYGYNVPQNKWILESSLTAPQGAVAFGWAVQTGNNLALISARRTGTSLADNGLDDGHGSAYMYAYDSTNGWTLVQSFAETGTTNYGNSLSMVSDGSLLAIGAPSRYAETGWVYIYKKSASVANTWTLMQAVRSPYQAGGTDFGISINFDIQNSSRLIIGSPNEGVLQIFNYDTSTQIWSALKTTGSSSSGDIPVFGPQYGAFGTNVALSGDYAFLSAPSVDKLLVYKKSPDPSTNWLLVQTLSKASSVNMFASSFYLADSKTLAVVNAGDSTTDATVGVYIYKYNSTTSLFVQSSFLACSVSDSQGQLPVGMLTYPSQQIIVGGSYGSQVSFFNFTRAPDPTATPTSMPTVKPTFQPSFTPTFQPTSLPTRVPTAFPTVRPSSVPTALPTFVPSFQPSTVPTSQPSCLPTHTPTLEPSSSFPTILKTDQPTSSSHFIGNNNPTLSPVVLISTGLNTPASSQAYVIPVAVGVGMFLCCLAAIIFTITVFVGHRNNKEKNKDKDENERQQRMDVEKGREDHEYGGGGRGRSNDYMNSPFNANNNSNNNMNQLDPDAIYFSDHGEEENSGYNNNNNINNYQQYDEHGLPYYHEDCNGVGYYYGSGKDCGNGGGTVDNTTTGATSLRATPRFSPRVGGSVKGSMNDGHHGALDHTYSHSGKTIGHHGASDHTYSHSGKTVGHHGASDHTYSHSGKTIGGSNNKHVPKSSNNSNGGSPSSGFKAYVFARQQSSPSMHSSSPSSRHGSPRLMRVGSNNQINYGGNHDSHHGNDDDDDPANPRAVFTDKHHILVTLNINKNGDGENGDDNTTRHVFFPNHQQQQQQQAVSPSLRYPSSSPTSGAESKNCDEEEEAIIESTHQSPSLAPIEYRSPNYTNKNIFYGVSCSSNGENKSPRRENSGIGGVTTQSLILTNKSNNGMSSPGLSSRAIKVKKVLPTHNSNYNAAAVNHTNRPMKALTSVNSNGDTRTGITTSTATVVTMTCSSIDSNNDDVVMRDSDCSALANTPMTALRSGAAGVNYGRFSRESQNGGIASVFSTDDGDN